MLQVAGYHESAACEELEQALAAVGDGAVRMAVGHNIVPFVASRCGGALQLLDVGMRLGWCDSNPGQAESVTTDRRPDSPPARLIYNRPLCGPLC